MARRSTVGRRGGFKIEGVQELRDGLAMLSSDVATKVGKRAVFAAAKELRVRLSANAPYKPGIQLKYRTTKKGVKSATNYGDLKDNIRVRLAKARKPTTVTYLIHTGDAFWGFFLEFGTRFLPANPWMRRTFDVAVGELLNTTTNKLRDGIERAAKRAKVNRR